MGFRLLPSNFLQTASNNAASIVAALVQAGEVQADGVLDKFNSLRSDIAKDLLSQVEKDNGTLAEEEKKSPPKRQGGTGGGGSITFDQAKSLSINGGKFDGMTIEAIYALSKSEAEEYGYNASGKQYVEGWLASEKNKNEYTRRRAKVFVDGVAEAQAA